MIIFDASYLVVFLNKAPEPAKDRQGIPVHRFKERVEYLASSINASGEQIGIPAPALAEVLVRAGRGRSQFVSILSDRMRFQLVPFDARAAIEAAELIALIKSKHETWGTHAKVKFDIQIVATAKAEDATIIYSDDRDIENFGKRLKIPVTRICDLPLPPPKEFPKIDTRLIGEPQLLFDLPQPSTAENDPFSEVDQSINEEGAGNESTTKPADGLSTGVGKASNEFEINTIDFLAVLGSDKGRARGETLGETATTTPEILAPKIEIAIDKPKATSEGGLGEDGS